jgi:hypothetical protein
VKHGGKIGLANWTPDSMVGQLFKTIGKYLPPAAGVKSPALWGTNAHLDAMFGMQCHVAVKAKQFTFRYKAPEHWLDVFKAYYGPVLKAFAALDPEPRIALEEDIMSLLARFNTAKDGTLVAPSDYLEVVLTKKM